jgi:hypothetical protein
LQQKITWRELRTVRPDAEQGRAMKKMINRVVLLALAAMAAHAFADTANKAEGTLQAAGKIPKTVAYLVEVMHDGQVVRTQSVLTVVGSPNTAKFGNGAGEAKCIGAGALGQRYALEAALGNEFLLTVLPAKEEAGTITTVVQASDRRAALRAATIDEGCVVPTGRVESNSVFDVAEMHKGDKRTFNLGDGTTLVLKLADIEG